VDWIIEKDTSTWIHKDTKYLLARLAFYTLLVQRKPGNVPIFCVNARHSIMVFLVDPYARNFTDKIGY
jgi:hypothetical protein